MEEESPAEDIEEERLIDYDFGCHDVMRGLGMCFVDGGLYHGRAEGLTDMEGHAGLHVGTGTRDQGKMQGLDITADAASHGDLQERMMSFDYGRPPRRRPTSCPGRNRRLGCISPTLRRISPRLGATPR